MPIALGAAETGLLHVPKQRSGRYEPVNSPSGFKYRNLYSLPRNKSVER
jgi:hypothetical protein